MFNKKDRPSVEEVDQFTSEVQKCFEERGYKLSIKGIQLRETPARASVHSAYDEKVDFSRAGYIWIDSVVLRLEDGQDVNLPWSIRDKSYSEPERMADMIITRLNNITQT